MNVTAFLLLLFLTLFFIFRKVSLLVLVFSSLNSFIVSCFFTNRIMILWVFLISAGVLGIVAAISYLHVKIRDRYTL